MSEKSKRNIRRWFVRAAVPLMFCAGLFPRCANVMAPQGGPKDTLPPVVVDMRPAYGTTNFSEKRIFIEFDEYVKLSNLQTEFFTSPQMEKKPSVIVKGRGIQIDIQDTLADNTTYAFDFASAVQDNNEGNPLHGLRYVFSTGDYIDSMLMSGYTVDGYTKDSISKAYIYFFEAWKDSMPEYDSTMFNARPDVIARANPNGIFIAQNLKPVDYRVYAMQDNNGNQQYEPGVDRIGFLDSIYNPLNMEPFTITYDTTRLYLVADPQLYFRMFMDDPFRRQILKTSNRPQQNLLTFVFGAPDPEIERFEFYNIDSANLVREYLRPERDSIAFWINLAPDLVPDTIKGNVTYIGHDSINVLTPTTQEFNLAWKLQESKQQEKERLQKEKEREEALAAGEELAPEPNPFKVKIELGSLFNPEKDIPMTFDYPLVELDSARISLDRVLPPAEGDSIPRYSPQRFRFEQDSLNIRLWRMKVDVEPGENYRLLLPSGVFRNILDQMNDTMRTEFSVMTPDKYATIKMDVIGKTPESQYVLQLLSTSGSLLNEIRHATTGTHYFNYVDPGSVRIRVIEDMNGNGVWDKGNLIERRQSERAEIYVPESGDDEIATKTNWELEFTIDMNRMFAPLTMEQVIEQLRKADEIKRKKWEKEQEKNAFRPQQQQPHDHNHNLPPGFDDQSMYDGGRSSRSTLGGNQNQYQRRY